VSILGDAIFSSRKISKTVSNRHIASISGNKIGRRPAVQRVNLVTAPAISRWVETTEIRSDRVFGSGNSFDLGSSMRKRDTLVTVAKIQTGAPPVAIDS
jgi:hypothetical protein